jgi:hypothetical protein
VTRWTVQIFFALLFALPLRSAPVLGQAYPLEIVDLAGNKFSTADGRITTLVIASSNESARAQKVGDNTPDFCLGNPKFRMITALEFVSHHSTPVRAIIRKLARRRVDAAARALQARYDAKQIKRNAGEDVIVAADFDNVVTSRFGISLGEHTFEVLLLDGKGELRAHWSDLPSREALEAALRAVQ